MELRNVSVSLAKRRVLDAVSHDVGAGVTALVGRNGAGKTTLMRVLTGTLQPDAGDVLRNGASIWASSLTMREHRRQLGWLPQDPGLPPRMTVHEFVTHAGWLKELASDERPHAVRQAVEATGLTEHSHRPVGQLSGGQRRRAAFAASLVGSPSLLLLDEPTVGLDPIQREGLLHRIREASTHGRVLLSTHLLEDVAMAADQWIALSDGQVTASGVVDRSSEASRAASAAAVRDALSAGAVEA